MWLTEKICVLDKLRSGMSYSAASYEFNIKKSIMILNKVSLNRNTHKTTGYILTS